MKRAPTAGPADRHYWCAVPWLAAPVTAALSGDVRDRDRDVVRRASGMGEAEQLRNSFGWGLGVSQHFGDLVGGDDTVESVGGKQEPVTLADGVLCQVGFYVVTGADGAQQNAAPRMRRGLGLGELAGLDHRPDEGVVVGQAGQPSVAEQVGPGVPDMHQRQPPTTAAHQGSDGGADAGILDLLRRGGDQTVQALERVPGLEVTAQVCDGGDQGQVRPKPGRGRRAASGRGHFRRPPRT